MTTFKFGRNAIHGSIPDGIVIEGNTVTFPEGEMIHDFQLRDETDWYRLPDGSALMHSIRDDTVDEEDYILVHQHSFEEIKSSLESQNA